MLYEKSIPNGYIFNQHFTHNPFRVYFLVLLVDIITERVYYIDMSTISEFIKQKRKEAGLTQEEFALRSGLGLRFVRELEQGKETVRMDKVNQALSMFGMEAVPGRKDD